MPSRTIIVYTERAKNGGGAATFDFVKDGSPSHSAKFEAIDVMRSLRAVRLAHAACEADAVARLAEDTDALSTNASECDVESSAAYACSIDVAGVLRGTVFVKPATPATGASTVKRAKLLHRLHTRSSASKPGCVLCVGPDGRVCLQPGGPTTRQGLSRRERTDRRLTAVRRRQLFSTFRFHSPGVAPLPSIDATGAVHWPDAGPVVDIQGSRAVWDLSSEEVDIYAAV